MDAIKRLIEAAEEWAPKAPNEYGMSGPGYTVYLTREAQSIVDAARAELEWLRDHVRVQDAI